MDPYNDAAEHTMCTRKRRRDYRSLEEGKDEPPKTHKEKARPSELKERKPQKNNLVSIDTNHLKTSEKVVPKTTSSQLSQSGDGSKTNGRWTSEEHRKFVEALKKFGKQWKKVEDYIQTRSGAQIRSHAQKYFLKIQKEYPGDDPYEIFKSKTPEVLEDTIFMKNKGESEDGQSSASRMIRRQESSPSPPQMEKSSFQAKEEDKDEESMSFTKSVQEILARKKSKNHERPQLPLYNSHQNDLLSIRSFFEHVKSTVGPTHAVGLPASACQEEEQYMKILNEFGNYRSQLQNANLEKRKMSNMVNTDVGVNTATPDMDPYSNHPDHMSGSKDSEMYRKICQEFIQMKHNYDRVKVAQAALRNTALEQSSLDNLIKASLNPMGGARPRTDSLMYIREANMGRKRAMTIDGPIRDKYVPLNHSKKSAFSSFKQSKNQATAQNTKDDDEESKHALEKEEPKLSRKRTHAVMAKENPSSSHQLLLSPSEDFSNRKRAKSF